MRNQSNSRNSSRTIATTPDKGGTFHSSSLIQHTFSSARRAEQTVSGKKKSSEKAPIPVIKKRNIPRPLPSARNGEKNKTYRQFEVNKAKIRPSKLDFTRLPDAKRAKLNTA